MTLFEFVYYVVDVQKQRFVLKLVLGLGSVMISLLEQKVSSPRFNLRSRKEFYLNVLIEYINI